MLAARNSECTSASRQVFLSCRASRPDQWHSARPESANSVTPCRSSWLNSGDPLADVMRAEHFHVTFLPITPARYQSPQQLPALAGLRDAFRQNVTDSSLRVDALRLVALPDQLLLAGIPEGHAVAQRASCWNALLSLEEWRDLLLQRHGGKQRHRNTGTPRCYVIVQQACPTRSNRILPTICTEDMGPFRATSGWYLRFITGLIQKR